MSTDTAPSLADLYAEKAKRTATTNPALSALYGEKAKRQGATAPAAPAARPLTPDEGRRADRIMNEGHPRTYFAGQAMEQEPDASRAPSPAFGRQPRPDYPFGESPITEESPGGRVVQAGLRAVPHAIIGGVKQLVRGETFGERVAGGAGAAFNAVPIVAGLTAAGAVRHQAGEEARAAGVKDTSIADVGGLPLELVSRGGRAAGEFVGRNAAWDQSDEGRAAGARSGGAIGEVGAQILAAKGLDVAGRAVPERWAARAPLADLPLPEIPTGRGPVAFDASRPAPRAPSGTLGLDVLRPKARLVAEPQGATRTVNAPREPGTPIRPAAGLPPMPDVPPEPYGQEWQPRPLLASGPDASLGRTDLPSARLKAVKPTVPPPETSGVPMEATDAPLAAVRAADAPPQATLRAKPGIGAVIKSQTNQSIGNLRQFSDRLFYATKEIQSVRDRLSGARLRDYDNAVGEMTPKERAGLTNAMMEGREPVQTTGQARFRDWWNDPSNPGNFASKLRDEYTKSGIRVTDPDAPGGFREIGRVRRYVPQRMTPEAMEQLKTDPAMQAEFYGEASKQGLSKEQADAVLGHYREPGVRSYFAGQEAPRKFKIPDKWRAPDVVQTIRETISRGTRNEAEQLVLKNRDPLTGKPRNVGRDGQMQGDLGDMLEEIRQKHGQGAADEAKDLFLEQVGRKPQSDLTHASKSVSNTIGAVNALRLYAGRLSTAVVQQTQHSMTLAFSGPSATTKAVGRVASHPLKVYDAALRAGAVEPMSNWSAVTGIHEGGTPRTPLQRATNVGTTPMALSDMTARLVAFETRTDVAAKLQRQLSGNVWQKGVAKTQIEAMDFPPQAAESFAKGLTPEQMDVLGQRIVEKTQGKINEATRIPLAKGPLGRIVMQGKNFGVEQTRNTWRVAGKQFFQAGNPVPAVTLIASAWLVGKGINAAKDSLVGPQKSRDDSDLSALQQGGLGGMAGDVAHAMIRAKSVREAQEIVDRLDSSQFMALVYDVGKLGAGEWSPPEGKDRIDVLVDAIHHAFPAESDFEKHIDRLFGDDSKLKDEIVKNSTNKGVPRVGSEDYVRRLDEAVK